MPSVGRTKVLRYIDSKNAVAGLLRLTVDDTNGLCSLLYSAAIRIGGLLP